jgi:hypothetical protein
LPQERQGQGQVLGLSSSGDDDDETISPSFLYGGGVGDEPILTCPCFAFCGDGFPRCLQPCWKLRPY